MLNDLLLVDHSNVEVEVKERIRSNVGIGNVPNATRDIKPLYKKSFSKNV
jgi:hypothetical protein